MVRIEQADRLAGMSGHLAQAGQWLARAEAGVRSDLAAASWVLANRAKVIRILDTLFELRRGGGTVVQVPEAKPIIRTLIQPDGDLVTFVDPILFDPSRDPAERRALLAAHEAALAARLPFLEEDFTDRLLRCLRAVRGLGYAGAASIGGVSWAALSRELTVLSVMAGAASAGHFAVRAAAGPILRWALWRTQARTAAAASAQAAASLRRPAPVGRRRTTRPGQFSG